MSAEDDARAEALRFKEVYDKFSVAIATVASTLPPTVRSLADVYAVMLQKAATVAVLLGMPADVFTRAALGAYVSAMTPPDDTAIH